MTAQAGEIGSERFSTVLLLGVLAAAVAFRLWLLAWADFPINDGALFLEFVRSTAASFPRLPETVVYNGFSLPFAYPPLAFWIGAALTRLGADSLEVIRVLPILMNILYVLLIALLLLKGGRTRLFTALVLLFFCFRMRSFEWLVMGGGLSRGLGSIFLIAALLAVTVPGPAEKRDLPIWRIVLGGAFVGGAILSHLEWGVLAAASLVVSRAFGARNVRQFLVHTVAAGATAIVVVLPWLLFVYGRHGLEPFLAASGTSSWNLLTSVKTLLELFHPAIANPFILIGGIAFLVRRDFFWIALVLLCVFLTPRHAPTPLSLPLSIFAAQGVFTAFGFARHFIRSRTLALGGLTAAIAAVLAANAYHQYGTTDGQFRPLAREAREAMAWVAANHAGATFAVFTTAPWYYDSSAEWFPTLAQARSTTTAQGRGWLPNRAFARTSTLGGELKQSENCPDVHARLEPLGRLDFVWAETKRDCFAAPGFAPIYKNERVTIFRFNSAPPDAP